MSAKQHTDALGTMRIGKLLTSIAIPSSLALFVTATYNLVDTVFVGRGVGPDAIGALTLVFPFQILVMAFGNLIGIGAASVVSRALGAGDVSRARRAVGSAVTVAVGVGLAVTLAGYVNPVGLVRLLGASEELEPLTLDYVRIILLAEPFLILNLATNNLIRAEGQAKVAMFTMVAGMLANIGLDPVFIFGLGWGVQGAAYATVIGRILTTFLVGLFYTRGSGTIRLAAGDLRPDPAVVWESIKIGASGFVRQTSTSVVQGIRNHLLVLYGGTVFISAFGVVFRSILFLAMPAMGIAQAVPPIAGYNYGAGQMKRVRRVVWVGVGACTAIMWAGLALMELAPEALFRLFSNDPELIAQGVPIMRVSALSMLAFAFYFMGPSFYQAIGKPMRAFILALGRPLIGVAVMCAGIRLVGPIGVVAADPIAIFVNAVVVVVFLRRSLGKNGDLVVAPVTRDTP